MLMMRPNPTARIPSNPFLNAHRVRSVEQLGIIQSLINTGQLQGIYP